MYGKGPGSVCWIQLLLVLVSWCPLSEYPSLLASGHSMFVPPDDRCVNTPPSLTTRADPASGVTEPNDCPYWSKGPTLVGSFKLEASVI